MLKARTVDALELLRRDEEADPELAIRVEKERRKMKLGLQIQELREKAKLTQSQLARLIGTSQPAIARMESGDYERLSITTLLRLGRALGLTLEISFKPDKDIAKRASTEVSAAAQQS